MGVPNNRPLHGNRLQIYKSNQIKYTTLDIWNFSFLGLQRDKSSFKRVERPKIEGIRVIEKKYVCGPL